jgi:hypothetical protein
LPALAVLAVALQSSASHGQTAQDPAAAEALYAAGRDLIAAGDWTQGCAKMEASRKLNAATTTLIMIARCREHDGLLTAARHEYHQALALSDGILSATRREELRQLAKAAIAALDRRIGKLRVVVPEAPEGLRVERDGRELPLATIGEPLPVDPGTIEIAASAPGYLPFRRVVTLGEGATAEVEIRLTPEPSNPPVAAAPPLVFPAPTAAPAPWSPPTPAAAEPPTEGGVPDWAWITGGAGLALVVVGVAFRLDALAAERELVDRCGEALECDSAAGYDPSDDNARKNRDYGLFVGFTVAGLVAATVAVVGMVTSR